MDKFSLARSNMVKGQVLPNKVVDEGLIAAMSVIPRHSFIPERFKAIAYSDEHIELNGNRRALAPIILAKMTQAVEIKDGDIVLNIAAGTGYTSAVFAQMAKKVVAVESDHDLASKANLVLKTLDVGNVILVNDKMSAGCPESGPYDVIFINGAVGNMPYALVDQLAEGGRMITAVNNGDNGGVITMLKRENGRVSRTDLFDAVVPLIKDIEGIGDVD